MRQLKTENLQSMYPNPTFKEGLTKSMRAQKDQEVAQNELLPSDGPKVWRNKVLYLRMIQNTQAHG